MGLLDSLLEVPEHLRVWQMAGVRHLYIDPLLERADASTVSPPALVDLASDSTASAAPVEQSSPGAPASPQAPAAGSLPHPCAATPAPAYPSQTAQARPDNPEPASRADDPQGAALPEDPDRWPLPWPTFFAKTPATPRLVITYRELGLDLAGQSDARRRDLWRRLIAAAGLAGQGLVAFWPLALPQGGELVEQPLHFACGVARLNPELVAVFGEISDPARQELAARATSAVVVLPPPHALYNPDPEVWEHVIATLRRH
jgi:hypothetical protein